MQPGETCEPPNTATCTAACQNRVPICGDAFVTAPETCDPPSADGTCDATCQRVNPCVACTGTRCADLAAGCAAISGGPSGCDTVLACIVSSGCAKNSTRQAAECYCGAGVDNTTCFGFNPNAPQGPCKAVMDTAVPGGPLAVGAAFFDTTTGLGSAVQETVCRASFCQSQCNLGGTAVCGNSVVEAGEQCDPPQPGFCSSTCQNIAPACGDGFVQPGAGETCEPPNSPTCDTTCVARTPVCGDGFITPPEQCDPPTQATDGSCSSTCTIVDASPCGFCTAANCADLDAGCKAISGGPSGCDTVLACIVSSGCAAHSTRQAVDCYCGAVDNTTCFGFNANAPQGPCKDVMNAAVPGGPLAVGAAYFDTTTGLGSAIQESVCRHDFCEFQCTGL